VIKNGRPGTIMPAWGLLGLTDQEIWLMLGYLRSE
jgi:mono/diheme cytochrome c family protein